MRGRRFYTLVSGKRGVPQAEQASLMDDVPKKGMDISHIPKKYQKEERKISPQTLFGYHLARIVRTETCDSLFEEKTNLKKNQN